LIKECYDDYTTFKVAYVHIESNLFIYTIVIIYILVHSIYLV